MVKESQEPQHVKRTRRKRIGDEIKRNGNLGAVRTSHSKRRLLSLPSVLIEIYWIALNIGV